MDIEQQINEALKRYDSKERYTSVEALQIRANAIEWLRHQQSIISQQASELGESLIYINELNTENNELKKALSKQSEEIERLKKINEIAINALKKVDEHYMDYIENNIEVDTAATRMDNTAEDALAEIKKLEENPHVNP